MMGNGKQGKPLHSQKLSLNFQSRSFVQGGGALVQYEKARVPYQGPGNGNPLFLAAGKPFPVFSYPVERAFREGFGKLPDAACPDSPFKAFFVKFLKEADIIAYGVVKKKYVLMDTYRHPAEPVAPQFLQFRPVIENFTIIIRIIAK